REHPRREGAQPTPCESFPVHRAGRPHSVGSASTCRPPLHEYNHRRAPMTLSAGSRLGPYAILSPLGAGGMGEVWKARDTRLDRSVAIKVLPQNLASDPEALERFDG